MRALRTNGRQTRLVADVPDPAAAPGEALVKPTRVLLGAADAEAALGGGGFTGTLGHLCVGVVKKLNIPADATPVLASRRNLLGKRVVISPTIACSSCDLCRAGLSAHCRSRRVMGLSGRDGCCAELMAVPVANLHAVSEAVRDDAAAMAVVLASALHVVQMVKAENKTYITVLGDSPVGLLTARVLSRLNKSVRLLGRSEHAARMCEKWGLRHRPMDEAGRRQDQDVVVDCTGSSAGLRLAMQFVRPRGTIVLKSPRALAPVPAGRPLGEALDPRWREPALDLTPLAANEVQLLGSRDGPLPDALAMLADGGSLADGSGNGGGLEVAGLIGRRFKLDEAAAALSAAADPDQPAVIVEI